MLIVYKIILLLFCATGPTSCLKTLQTVVLKLKAPIYSVSVEDKKVRYLCMRFLEALNRMLVGMLLSLVVLQAGLLFFMKNMEEQAQFRLVQNTSKINSQCGNFFDDEKYWNIEASDTQSLSRCESSDCTYSHVTWDRPEQQKNLQVIAVKTAPTFRWDQMDEGGVVRVRVKSTSKPVVLALISQQRLEWVFQVDKGVQIDRVVVATPQTVWLQGLPPQTPIEYLPKEKMCSYPYAWQDAFNPDNEFRVMSSVLKQITGLEIDTFQGAVVGKEFRIPMYDTLGRGLASVEEKTKPSAAVVKLEKESNPIQWGREGGVAIPQKMVRGSQEIVFPTQTQQVVVLQNKIFILKNYFLWTWSDAAKTFERVFSPSTLPNLQYIKAIAMSESQQKLFIYNDERGGEMYSFDVANGQWSELHQGYSYNLEALYFDEQIQGLCAVASRGPHLTQFLKMDAQAKVQDVKELKTKIAFDKKNWKWQLQRYRDMYAVRFYQAVQPQGQDVVLDL